jgi:hypothetical protein
MLNPTGLGGFLKGQALPLGRGLKERRRWLADGVESWAECYQGPESSTAAALLYRLAFVALDVSLSDMHLVAGRSNNVNDGNFAEHNLMHCKLASHIYKLSFPAILNSDVRHTLVRLCLI